MDIKEVIDGRDIEKSDFCRLSQFLKNIPRTPSEYSIANIYSYRHRHKYLLAEGPESPCILGTTYDGLRHAMPLGALNPGSAQALLEKADCIFPLSEEEAGMLCREGEFEMSFNRADSDYIYAAASLRVLSGAKVKRAQARAFEASSAPIVVEIGPTNLGMAAAVLDGWLSDVGRATETTDYPECLQALADMSSLGLTGFLVLTGDHPAGFMLVDPDRGEEHIIHFAKGRRHLSGVYPWMFSWYARNSGAVTLNFEQDLGNPGLAQSKKVLMPAAIRHKYRIRRRAIVKATM